MVKILHKKPEVVYHQQKDICECIIYLFIYYDTEDCVIKSLERPVILIPKKVIFFLVSYFFCFVFSLLKKAVPKLNIKNTRIETYPVTVNCCLISSVFLE